MKTSLNKIVAFIYQTLRWSERWTKTDMIYLTKGGFLLTAGQMVSGLAFFLLSIAFANLLPAETYGSYKFILSVAAILAIPTLGSINTVVTQAVARGYEGSVYDALKTKLKWSIFGSIASVLVAGYYFLQANTELAIAFLMVAAFLPTNRLFKLSSSFLEGKKLFRKKVTYGSTSTVLSIAILIIAITLTDNLFIILFTYFIPQITIDYLFFKKVERDHHFNDKKDPATIPYGIYLSVLGVITTIANNIDKVLLWHFIGPAHIALYSFAIAPVEMVKGIVSTNVTTLAFPKLSTQSDMELKHTLPRKVVQYLLLLFPIIIFYVFFAPPIFYIFYPTYVPVIPYSQLYALSLLVLPTTLLGNAFIARMKRREVTTVRILSPSIRITFLLLLTPMYGILGVIISQIAGGFLHVGLVSVLFIFMKESPSAHTVH